MTLKATMKMRKIKGDKPRIMIPEFPEKSGIKLYICEYDEMIWIQNDTEKR